MARLFPQTFQAHDENSDAAAGARLSVYEAGTLTPVDTFSDAGLTTLQTKPIVADSGGYFDAIYVAGGRKYRYILRTSAGVTLDDQDNIVANDETDNQLGLVFDTLTDAIAYVGFSVNDTFRTLGYNTIGDGGGNDYQVVAAATGTDDGGAYIDLTGSSLQAKGLFPLGPNFNQWGATGDGATNDAPAIQAALDWWFDQLDVADSQQKIVGVPGSEYYVTSEIALVVSSNKKFGIIDFNGSMIVDGISAGSNVIDISADGALWRNWSIVNLWIAMATADAGLFIDGGVSTSSEFLYRFVIDHPIIEGVPAGSKGIHIKNNTFEFNIYDPEITAVQQTLDTDTVPILIESDTDEPTSVGIQGGTVAGGYYGIWNKGAGAPKLSGNLTVLLASSYGIYIDTASAEGGIHDVHVENCQEQAIDTEMVRWQGQGTIVNLRCEGNNAEFRVDGGSQSGTTLVVDGFSGKASGMLPAAGDTFTIDGVTGTYEIDTGGVQDDGGGQYTLTLTSSLAASPADDATCTFASKGGIRALRVAGGVNGPQVIGVQTGGQVTSDLTSTTNGDGASRIQYLDTRPSLTEAHSDTRLERAIAFVYDTSTVNAGNQSSSYTFDMDDGNACVITATGDVTFANPDSAREGLDLMLIFIQDGTGGRRLTFGNQFENTRPPNQAADSVTVYRWKYYLNKWRTQSVEGRRPVYNNGNTTGAYVHDMRDGGKVKLTATGNVTFNTSNEVGDDVLTLIFIQDGTGSRTLSFNAKFKTSGTSVSATAGEATVFQFVWDGAAWWEESVIAGVT